MNIKSNILGFILQHKLLFILYVLCTFTYPLNDVLLPNLYSKVITSIQDKGLDLSAIRLIIGLWFLIQFSMFVMDRIDAWFMPKLQRHLRESILEKIMETFKENYRELEIGDILSKIIKLPQIVGHLIEQIREFFIPITMIIIFVIIYLSRISKGVTIIFCLNIALILFMSISFQGKCTDKSVCREKAGNMVFDNISDLFNNILNIYTSDKIKHELNSMNKIEDTYESGFRDTIICSSKFRSTFYFMNFVMLFTVMGYSYKDYKIGSISNTQLLSILMIVLILLSKMNDMTIEIRNFISSIGSLKSIQSYLDSLTIMSSTMNTDNDNLEQEEIQSESNTNYAISVQNLRIQYPNTNTPVIQNLSFNIKKGEHVGILGRNGSGKSTLVKTILKLLKYEGNIYYNGKNLQGLSRKELQRIITYVPQHQVLFNRSIYQNIIYGVNRYVSKEEVDRLIRSLNLSRILIKNDSQYLDKIVGKNGNSISGGQRQIIFLLRCYLRNTPIIIFDEVTSALDQENKAEIKKLLNLIIKGKTLLMITHNPEDLQYLDRKIELSSSIL